MHDMKYTQACNVYADNIDKDRGSWFNAKIKIVHPILIVNYYDVL